jgi:2'-5' RNA ligase
LTAPHPVVDRPRDTALTVVVPEARDLVDPFRRRFHARSIARRIPPHVTVLYPLADADAVDGGLLAALEELCGAVEPFAFELARVARFDAVVWLAPEPRRRFVDLIEATCARFPERPPYGGEFAGSRPVPHLTVGEGEDVEAIAAAAERELAGRLPLACAASAVALLEERPDGTWAERAAFPLGGRA